MLKNDFQKEYRIIRQHGKAKPYTLWTYNSFEACYQKLLELISTSGNRFGTDYYVYNDFFENEHTKEATDKYMIECRDVGEWIRYSEKENVNNNEYYQDNIIYLQKRG